MASVEIHLVVSGQCLQITEVEYLAHRQIWWSKHYDYFV